MLERYLKREREGEWFVRYFTFFYSSTGRENIFFFLATLCWKKKFYTGKLKLIIPKTKFRSISPNIGTSFGFCRFNRDFFLLRLVWWEWDYIMQGWFATSLRRRSSEVIADASGAPVWFSSQNQIKNWKYARCPACIFMLSFRGL